MQKYIELFRQKYRGIKSLEEIAKSSKRILSRDKWGKKNEQFI